MKYARRHAAAVALCEALPLPLLDTALQNRVRRNLVRTFAETRGDELSEAVIREVADEELVPWDRMLWWPVKKVVSKVVPFWTAWEMFRAYNETLAFAQQQHEVATLPRVTDPYATLECEPGASHAELKKAYRRLARTWHPDRNDAPEAEARFREIASAWEILGDTDRRRRYDLQIGAVARGELPEPFVLDVADAIERAEAWIRRGVLPTYAQHWRGRGAEMAARLWADLDELVTPSALELTRKQERLGAKLAEPVIVTAWTRPAAGATVLIRGTDFWEVGVVPQVLWDAGFRESAELDDAVMRLLLARYAQVVATGRLPWPDITIEEARAIDEAALRREWTGRALWGGTALLIAGMLCAGYFQL